MKHKKIGEICSVLNKVLFLHMYPVKDVACIADPGELSTLCYYIHVYTLIKGKLFSKKNELFRKYICHIRMA